MSLDDEIRLAIRKGGPLGQEHLKLLARLGAPHMCCFCSHAVLALQETCGHTREYQVGDAVYYEGAFIGKFLGDKKVQLFNFVHDEVVVPVPAQGLVMYHEMNGQRFVRAVVELPEAWKPTPCTCDHRVATPETSMQAYQEKHGVDLRVIQAINPGRFYHIRNRMGSYRNGWGVPQRWAANGRVKTWKTRPGKFRLPIKHGMRTYDALDESNCKMLRTEASWALRPGEATGRMSGGW